MRMASTLESCIYHRLTFSEIELYKTRKILTRRIIEEHHADQLAYQQAELAKLKEEEEAIWAYELQKKAAEMVEAKKKKSRQQATERLQVSMIYQYSSVDINLLSPVMYIYIYIYACGMEMSVYRNMYYPDAGTSIVRYLLGYTLVIELRVYFKPKWNNE